MIKAHLIEFNNKGKILKRRKVKSWLCTGDTPQALEVVLDRLETKFHESVTINLKSLVDEMKDRGLF